MRSLGLMDFSQQCPKRGSIGPFLALIHGTPSQGIQNKLEFWVIERVYQLSSPGRTNKPLFWMLADKRILPDFNNFGQNVDQIWPVWQF